MYKNKTRSDSITGDAARVGDILRYLNAFISYTENEDSYTTDKSYRRGYCR